MDEGVKSMGLTISLMYEPIQDVSFYPPGPMISGALSGPYQACPLPYDERCMHMNVLTTK